MASEKRQRKSCSYQTVSLPVPECYCTQQNCDSNLRVEERHKEALQLRGAARGVAGTETRQRKSPSKDCTSSEYRFAEYHDYRPKKPNDRGFRQ